MFFRVHYYCCTLAAPRDWGRWSQALSTCVTRIEVTGDWMDSSEKRHRCLEASRTTGCLACSSRISVISSGSWICFPPARHGNSPSNTPCFFYHQNSAVLSNRLMLHCST
ncbi:unnamed protein product [Ectocarpus sp. 8 AP-2014]